MALAGAALSLAASASAQDNGTQADPSNNKIAETGKKAGEIVTQPARDIGVAKKEIPPALEKASEDPYDLKGLKSCKQLAHAVTELNEALGPDFVTGSEKKKDNRAGKLAEAGGQTIVNSFIPFRGLVREITGAAPAQRRLNAAIDAGYARRGFLRGVHHMRNCKTRF
jgi:hypothetical protein